MTFFGVGETLALFCVYSDPHRYNLDLSNRAPQPPVPRVAKFGVDNQNIPG